MYFHFDKTYRCVVRNNYTYVITCTDGQNYFIGIGLDFTVYMPIV